MSRGMAVLLVVLLVVGVVVGSFFLTVVGVKNNLVKLDEGIEEAWAQVETVLQRRFDLIPNLVNTVKGYAKQESGVLERVTELRSQWGAARSVGDKVAAAGQLEGALARLLLVSENYPDLKSNQNFIMLQDELAGTENRIAVERRRYNEAVRSYNTAVRQFPGSLVGAMFGFAKRDVYFEAAQDAGTAPNVQF
jgi:LemA protein